MPCIIQGCTNVAKHYIGVRLRRPNTSAIWAANTNAYVCRHHASQGLEITIILRPTNTGRIETWTRSPRKAVLQ